MWSFPGFYFSPSTKEQFESLTLLLNTAELTPARFYLHQVGNTYQNLIINIGYSYRSKNKVRVTNLKYIHCAITIQYVNILWLLYKVKVALHIVWICSDEIWSRALHFMYIILCIKNAYFMRINRISSATEKYAGVSRVTICQW